MLLYLAYVQATNVSLCNLDFKRFTHVIALLYAISFMVLHVIVIYLLFSVHHEGLPLVDFSQIFLTFVERYQRGVHDESSPHPYIVSW